MGTKTFKFTARRDLRDAIPEDTNVSSILRRGLLTLTSDDLVIPTERPEPGERRDHYGVRLGPDALERVEALSHALRCSQSEVAARILEREAIGGVEAFGLRSLERRAGQAALRIRGPAERVSVAIKPHAVLMLETSQVIPIEPQGVSLKLALVERSIDGQLMHMYSSAARFGSTLAEAASAAVVEMFVRVGRGKASKRLSSFGLVKPGLPDSNSSSSSSSSNGNAHGGRPAEG